MKIAIVGGGIAGLTTALALNKVGFAPTVFERAENLNEIGAGVWLQPNAIQVLKWLGIHAEIEKEGCTLNKMEITYPNLKPIKRIKSQVVSDNYGNQTVAIHRGKLQKILYNKCKEFKLVKLGTAYQKHQIDEKKVTVYFEHFSAQFDVLIGADGIKSQVRKSMGLPSEYRSSKQICCRGIAYLSLPDHLKNEGKEVWGSKVRMGFSQLSPEQVYFFTVVNKDTCPAKITKESLIDLFKDFDPILLAMIKASEDMHTTELMDLKRLKTWHDSAVCLIGDAAHATTPNMGQGACQGIEDAFAISQALKNNHTPVLAFSTFEKLRRKKVDYVVNNSWKFGQLAHNTLGQNLLKLIMKATPEKTMSNQMNKLYKVEGL